LATVAARDHPIGVRMIVRHAKTKRSLSDGIATVRRLFWIKTILGKSSHNDPFEKTPGRLRDRLLDRLSQAA